MKKYIFFGAGEYGRRLLQCIDSSKMIGFCDNYKHGEIIDEKKVYSIDELHKLEMEYIVVIAIEKNNPRKEIMQQLKQEKIPFIQPTQMLLQENVEDLSFYPHVLDRMAREYGMKFSNLGKWNQELFREWDKKYHKIVICILSPSVIGSFCWMYGTFKRFADSHRVNVCYGICKDTKAKDKKYEVPNQYLYEKMMETFPEINRSNINDWFIYLCVHFDKVEVFDYNEAQTISKKTLREFYEKELNFYNLNPSHPSIIFSEKEESTGKQLSFNMGILNPFVCFFSRDNSYMKKEYHRLNDEEYFYYKSCERVRNSDVQRYSLMASNLKKNGICSVRMGSVVEKKFIGDGIDYSNLERSEFMDLYLFSKCMFFIGDGSGILCIPTEIFNKPIISIHPPDAFCYKGDAFVYSGMLLFYKLYNENTGHYLSFREILNISRTLDFNIMKIRLYWCEHNIRSHPVSEEEIWEAAEEMINLLNGTQKYTDEDLNLRYRFRDILLEYLAMDDSIGGSYGWPCAAWLRKNQWFLE